MVSLMLISAPENDVKLPDVAALTALYQVSEPALAMALPELARQLDNDQALNDLCLLFDETSVAAPGLATDLAPHIGYLLNALDVAGLRRWILTGLRLYPNHPAKLAAFFRLEDPLAAQCLVAETQGVSFERTRHVLELYLTGFGQSAIALQARTQRNLNAPALRTVISDATLALPDHYLAWDGGLRGDVYRASASHALAHLYFSPRHQPAGKRKPLLLTMLALIEDARVERLMALRYPGLRALWGRFHVATGEQGELDFASLSSRLARALHDPSYEDQNHWVNKGRDLFEAIADNLEHIPAFVEVGSILANDLGQMRVRFNPQAYVIQPAYRDDNTFLWRFDSDPPDTPPEESMAQQSVQIEPTESGADEAMIVAPIEIEPGMRWHYPEWDHKAEIMRERWTTVIDRGAEDRAQRAAATGLRSNIRKVSLDTQARLLDRGVRLRRQHEGEELDLNAVIETRISQRARLAPDPRIFQRPGKRRRHTSILLLLDLSESTNDAVMGTFTSLLDLEKRAASLVAQSIDTEYDRLAIAGFCSDGREKVHYTRIKDFDQAFSVDRQQTLNRQQGSLSTRMGAALRHAGCQLDAEASEKKILLLVTDGEPSDIDVIDKNYLVEDARMAVHALNMKSITVFCLTLDPRADPYVKTIFGAQNYLIVDKAVTLPTQLAQALTRLAAR
jgi:hypothetical protein